jgi:hypothetical protein
MYYNNGGYVFSQVIFSDLGNWDDSGCNSVTEQLKWSDFITGMVEN